ncbi:hypothetical protein KC316_g7405 [Hortaea werneckii]|nr:hypothetical protein KC355_g8367 [Hortaea werneckii]KAI7187770.1 hypothetical protein KC324_g6820 [Hortaea werneckii]KAI7583221.1 hypothetical protein KC316_g7405 [Hortaea werneckii]
MPTHPKPNFTTLLTTLPHLTLNSTHNLLRACQKLTRDWHSLSHTQRLLALCLAVQRYGPRDKRYAREKQKAVATGMCLLQLWMYRGIRVRGRGREKERRVVGRKGRKAVGARKGASSRVVPANRAVQDPRVSRDVLEEEEEDQVQRDGVVEATTRNAATQTYEATTSSPRSSTAAAAATPAQSTTTTAAATTTTPSILHHQLAHLHAEFASLQHAFFALQAGNISLHNYVLDQQIRNQVLLNGLRAENRTLQIESEKKCEGLEGEIEQLRTENARLKGFVQRMRDEAGRLLAMDRRDGAAEEGGEDSGIGGEV